MYRISLMTNQWYALEIDSVEDDLENIEQFIDEGTIITLVDDLDNFINDTGVSRSQITVAAKDETEI